MEPNIQNTTPIPTPPVVNQPIEPVTTQPIMQTVTMQPSPEKSNKMLFLILTTVILIGLGVGGIFFLTNRQTVPQTKITPPTVSQVSPSPIPTAIPSPQPTQTPEQALQDVIITDPATDMADINTDISQL